jgi:transcriptional regulator with XRE-family HTH domain
VTFQQVQKYEKGGNRVPASRLPAIAQALGVSIPYFYGYQDATAGIDAAAVSDTIGLLAERNSAELLTCFRFMTAPQRRAFLEFGRLIAAANGATAPKDAPEEDAIILGDGHRRGR